MIRNYLLQNIRTWFGYYNFDLMDNILCEGSNPLSTDPTERYLDFDETYKLHLDLLTNAGTKISKLYPFIGISFSDLTINTKFNCETTLNVEFQIVYPNSPADCLQGCNKCISNTDLFVDEVTEAIIEAFYFDNPLGEETNMFNELYNSVDPITNLPFEYPIKVLLNNDPIRTDPEVGFDETTIFNIIVPIKVLQVGTC